MQGRYDIEVVPYSMDSPGDVIQIAVSSSGRFKLLVNQVAAYDEEPIFAGTISGDEAFSYDSIALTTYHPEDPNNPTWLNQSPEKDAWCDIPEPGAGSMPNTTRVK